MRKFLSVLLLFSFVFSPSYIFAQEETIEEPILQEELIAPTSPFYFLTELFEDVQLLLTFDQEKKVEKALQFAEKKLNSMEGLEGEEDSKIMERLEKRFEKLVENAERIAQKDETMNEESLQKVEQIRERHLNVLNTVLEKAPEGQAQESIQKVIDKTIEKYNERDEKEKTNNRGGVDKDDRDDDDDDDDDIEEDENEDIEEDKEEPDENDNEDEDSNDD